MKNCADFENDIQSLRNKIATHTGKYYALKAEITTCEARSNYFSLLSDLYMEKANQSCSSSKQNDRSSTFNDFT